MSVCERDVLLRVRFVMHTFFLFPRRADIANLFSLGLKLSSPEEAQRMY